MTLEAFSERERESFEMFKATRELIAGCLSSIESAPDHLKQWSIDGVTQYIENVLYPIVTQDCVRIFELDDEQARGFARRTIERITFGEMMRRELRRRAA